MQILWPLPEDREVQASRLRPGVLPQAAEDYDGQREATEIFVGGRIMNQRYECDQCGACCRKLLVEAGWYDVAREPKLLIFDNEKRQFYGHPPRQLADLKDPDSRVLLYDSDRHCCPFLIEHEDGSTKCDIYPTRPNECVGCEAGSPKCQQARMHNQMPLLRDVDGSLPDLSRWHEQYDADYGADFIDELIQKMNR